MIAPSSPHFWDWFVASPVARLLLRFGRPMSWKNGEEHRARSLYGRDGVFEFSYFHVSSFSGGGDCVAVARLADGDVAVRHSKDPSKSTLVFTSREWEAFVEGVRAGEFD